MLADRYRQVRRIASSGMGTVYEGVDERLGRRVAIKLLKEEYAEDPLFVERFGREARAAASLDHPNIAQIFDSGQHGGRHFIVMEFLDGEDLGHMLRQDCRLPADVAVSVTAQVCSALAAAHTAGVVHRDIKPGNVLVRADGRVKVTDFGIAQVQGQASLTGAGLVLGTARYLSPEQACGQAVTPASDLYSAGVLLFQMLTGNVPFTGDSPVAVALSHVREKVPSVHDFAPEVPPPTKRPAFYARRRPLRVPCSSPRPRCCWSARWLLAGWRSAADLRLMRLKHGRPSHSRESPR